LGQPADPLTPTPMGIHPEWYFMSQFQALKVFGRVIPGLTGEIFGMAVFGAVMLFWALVPLFDPKTATGKRVRTTAWTGFGILVGMLVFTIWGYATL
jgi:quinol-cytochrome oxidoreductase complex cytochrome b subunit